MDGMPDSALNPVFRTEFECARIAEDTDLGEDTWKGNSHEIQVSGSGFCLRFQSRSDVEYESSTLPLPVIESDGSVSMPGIHDLDLRAGIPAEAGA